MNPILAGILMGTGQAGTNIAAARKDREDRALREQQVGFQERQINLAEQKDAREAAERAAFVGAAEANPDLAPFKGMLGSREGAALAQFLIGERRKAAEKAQTLEAARKVGPMIPGSEERTELQWGEEEGAGMLPQTTPADPRAKLMRSMVESGLLPLKDVLPTIFQKSEPFSLSPGQQRFDASGKPIASVPAKPEKGPQTTETVGGRQYRITFDAEGNVANRVDIGPAVPKVVPIAPGGSINTVEFGSGGAPRVTQIAQRDAPPDASERKDIAQLNAMIPLGQDLLRRWDAEMPSKLAQGGEREIALGWKLSDLIGPTMTDTQRRFVADATDLQAAYRAIRSGLAVTNPEARRSMPLVPDDPTALTKQQLAALVAWGDRNRDAIQAVLRSVGRNPGPTPGAAPAGRNNDPLGIRR